MSGKIQIVGPDDVEAVSDYDGAVMQRDLASKARGSTRMQFVHAVVTHGVDFGDVVNEDRDQVVYILSGEMELVHEGQTHLLGPGHFFLVPQGAAFGAKVTAGPLEVFEVYAASD